MKSRIVSFTVLLPCLSALLLNFAPAAAQAATITVTSTSDSGAQTLRNAISIAAGGDTIDFDLSYPATITLATELAIDKDLTIQGPGAENLTLSGNNSVRVFKVDSGTVTIQDLTIASGKSALGGGIYNQGSLLVTNCVFSGNSATFFGGGIFNFASLTVKDSDFSGNSADVGGGLMTWNGTVAVTNCTFSGNNAWNEGGGIAGAETTMAVTNCTFSGNSARYDGGGMLIYDTTASITNSTFSRNSADYGGGALMNDGTTTVTNCTFSNNSPGTGGTLQYGDFIRPGVFSLRNSIIVASSRGRNCQGNITDEGGNIDDGSTCGFGGSSQSNTDPRLDAGGVKDNGGRTSTIALLAGSPAIDAGDAASCPAKDQRGIERPQGSSCDSGAYEFVPTTTTVLGSSRNPSVYGESVTFTATIEDSEAASTPIGTVTFKDGGVEIGGCAAVTLSSGAAACNLSTLSAGSHTITAEYASSGGYDSSTAAGLIQAVNLAATKTALAASPNPTIYGQTITFTAIVSSKAGKPPGTVAFKDGTIDLGSRTLADGKATFTTAAMAGGSHTITAEYGGDGNFTPSKSSTLIQEVDRAATTTEVMASTVQVVAGKPAIFTAAVTPVVPGSGTPTGTVAFKDGTTILGMGPLSEGRTTYSSANLAAGRHSITAVYHGDGNYSGSVSSAITQRIRLDEGVDFNDDGRPDILWQHQTSGDLAVWYLNGATAIGAESLTPSRLSDPRWKIAGVGDFNEDGQPDILWQHQTGGDLAVWYLNGATAIGAESLTPSRLSDPRWKIAEVGDFNEDGQPDILWQHQTGGDLAVWYLNGATAIEAESLAPSRLSDPLWKIAGVGDFNGDGRPDILWQHQTGGDLAVWYLNGVTAIGAESLTPSRLSDPRWKIAEVGDFNEDGQPDILWQHQTGGDLAVWYLNGATVTGAEYLNPPHVIDSGWKIVGL